MSQDNKPAPRSGKSTMSEQPRDELGNEETNPFPISSMKFTDPTLTDKMRNLYTTLEQFYLISHRIRNTQS